MNKAKLKSYAPTARRDFMQAVTDRAHFFGISEKEIVPVEESGDVAIIGGRPFPRAVASQRRKLDARVKRYGFSQVMETVAYTWFNRFLALHYMELHGYLEHGFRVLSSTGSSNTPEILDHAAQLDLPGLNKQKVTELKLDGNKDAELYRILLVAQCNALHSAMPFLFEKIEDETELLLPDNLLHSDSLIRKLVTEIEEEDWQEVEIIGWLYQFYISEKKDQVIGKVVKSEDIPAATQLFTPNWIVKYMVQNSLGRQWLATYPDSSLKSKMEYYIEPAKHSNDVNAQLASITPDSLDPEKLTLLDPASGSGHILVEAYDLFKEIYLERGYSNRDFPRLILEKNLYGLDIDDRAAQMAGFALLMKARKDDRRILRSDKPVKLNVLAIQESGSISVDKVSWGENSNLITELVELFKHAKTFGSLIQIPLPLQKKLAEMDGLLRLNVLSDNMYIAQNSKELSELLEQAKLLAGKYDFIVANPPYMGSKGMNSLLKEYALSNYSTAKSDIFSMFTQRIYSLIKPLGYCGLMTPFVWMFLKSYENLRKDMLEYGDIVSLVRPEYHSFFESAFVPICTFVLRFAGLGNKLVKTNGVYVDLSDFYGYEAQPLKYKKAVIDPSVKWRFETHSDEFKKVPGWAIAYWLSNHAIKAFEALPPFSEYFDFKQGLATGNNDIYLRYWHEPSSTNIGYGLKNSDEAIKSKKRWFPCQKGGENRRWYGNHNYLVDWENNGERLKNFGGAVIRNPQFYFKKGGTWSSLTVSSLSMRLNPEGFVFESKGAVAFPINDEHLPWLLALANSIVINHFLAVLAPTMDYSQGPVGNVPFKLVESDEIPILVNTAVEIAKSDWDSFETSWDFKNSPLLNSSHKANTTKDSWNNWNIYLQSQVARMQELETDNNRLFIDAYELQNELSPEVSEDKITLSRANAEADVKRLISYSIGCIMGRFSLDQTGLVYANNGNEGFDSDKYRTFPADDDGIVPVMDMDWFPDDAASRFEEFLKVAWSPETLEENLKFTADSLSPKGGETPRETIRRYVSTQFYKDHLQTYKKRPIYWLFSSGKQRAFECLVYLHRYNESTLSRMRNEYVTPLQGKLSAQTDYLSNEVNAASSTAERNRLQKQLDTLRKKQVELASFDDLLRHYADQRISLDLDDGVKVNYGKFGALLAEVKAVTGGGE